MAQVTLKHIVKLPYLHLKNHDILINSSKIDFIIQIILIISMKYENKFQ